MLAEAEPGAERETHEPVGAEMADHRSAGVASASEGAGGDGLDTVEELKGSAGGKEDDGVVDEYGIVGVNAGDVLGEDQEDDAHDGHEGSAEEDGGVAGVASTGEIAASDGLADADCGGGRDAQRNHIGEGDSVEGDLVTGERDGAEAGDQGGDGGEDGDLGGHLHSGGEAESDEAPDARQIGEKRGLTQVSVVAGVVPEKKNDEDRGEVGAGDRRCDAGADNAEHGESPVAEDQEIVAEGIDEIGGDEGEGDGADQVHALEGAAEGEVEKKREQAEG